MSYPKDKTQRNIETQNIIIILKQTQKIIEIMPCGKKRKRHKIATHKRKKRLRKNRHKKRNK